ncbi:hypothetical protein D3C72_2281570 [compost metagenome]
MDGKMGASPNPTIMNAPMVMTVGNGSSISTIPTIISRDPARIKLSLFTFIDTKPLNIRPAVIPRKKRETQPAAFSGRISLTLTK